MRLIERDTFLDRLLSLLSEAAGGRGSLVVLEGEAGAGKSTLANAFARSLPAATRLLTGACENFGTAEPLGPLLDVAREARWALTHVSGDNWLALFSEVLDLLDRADAPTLLIIEDIHWADDATLNLIRYLGRRIRTRRIMLLVTARNDDLASQARLRQLLTDIPPAHRHRIDVPALTKAAVLQLANAHSLDGEAIFRTTGGNAYFVTELVDVGEPGRLPASISDAVLARADALSPLDRDVLAAASTTPEAFEPAFIDAICGATARASLEACVARGLLVQLGAEFSFRHDIARQAIEQSLPPSRRCALNEKALAFFRNRGDASIARMAHHAHQAQDIDAIRTLAPKAAAQAARLGAHREAARHYELALAHAAGLDPGERARLYENYAFESHLIGHVEQAVSAQTHALALHRERGDLIRVGDNLRWLSRLSYLAANRRDADSYGRQAVEMLEALPALAERAMAYSTMSLLAMLAGETDAATDFGERAIALVTDHALERPDILCHALNNVGTAIYWRDPSRARAMLDKGLETALQHDFHEHAARLFTNRAWIEIRLHGSTVAEDVLRRGIAYCIERDLDTWRDYMRGELAELLIFRGRWQEAAELAQSVVDNPNAGPLARFPALAALATLKTRRGEPADDLLAEISLFMEDGCEFQRLSARVELSAERAWLGLGGRDAAIAQIREASAHSSDDLTNSMVHFWNHMLGEAAFSSNRPNDDPALTALQQGEWLAAATIWRERGAAYLSALALLNGDDEALYKALAILEALGATAVAEHAKGLIRDRTGRVAARGPRASTRANPAGLTRREMDVLRLIDEGRTNAEIGSKLFISAKTADHHASAIMSKLEAKSRGAAAARARKLGLLG